MDKSVLIAKIKSHLDVLCSSIGERRVGSDRNRRATAYAENVLREAGWSVESTQLQVMDWITAGTTVTCGADSFEAFSSHYSLGCDVRGELVAIDSIDRLRQADITGKIVLLHGEIASQQIAPKNFPFWNPEEHQRIIALLEHGNPLALVCATERNSATAGGIYPFPLIEDGDFDIPSVYMKDTEGERLLQCAGQVVTVVSHTERIPETAFNIIGRNAEAVRLAGHISETVDKAAGCSSSRTVGRIVVSAHIDTKIGTPGAIDNATGVAAILALAELLKETGYFNESELPKCSKLPIELVIFNGEDYYGAPGQLKYIEQNEGRFDEIALNINIDGAGYHEGLTCFSQFDLPEEISAALNETLRNNPAIVDGEPWYQSDHSLFLQQGRPAIAVASQWFIENMESQELTHTPKDNLGIVNYERVAECAAAIAEFTGRLGNSVMR